MTRGPIIRSTVVIALLAMGLVALDGLLARTEMREVQGEAAKAFRQGTDLLQHGKSVDAIVPLRKAWVLERENPVYTLELGNALARIGKLNEAEPLINDALSHNPDDGEANLAAARLMIRRNALQEATSYFHRAIYGEWKNNAPVRRSAARMELVELLAEQKHYQEMLAELISLDAETEGQDQIRRRIAHFYMLAGSPARAANLYRALEQKDPMDIESLIGLGEAELKSGHYRAARTAFVRAAMHSPGSPIQSRLQLVDTLTALDPTPRQLTSIEKYRRSRRILDLARADLEQQVEANPNRATPETGALLKQVAETLSKKEPAHVNNEMAEGVLTLAEEVWRARIKDFGGSVSQEEEPLRLLVERLTS
jgi:tetratricopeptide (TPR) repeat protein